MDPAELMLKARALEVLDLNSLPNFPPPGLFATGIAARLAPFLTLNPGALESDPEAVLRRVPKGDLLDGTSNRTIAANDPIVVLEAVAAGCRVRPTNPPVGIDPEAIYEIGVLPEDVREGRNPGLVSGRRGDGRVGEVTDDDLEGVREASDRLLDRGDRSDHVRHATTLSKVYLNERQTLFLLETVGFLGEFLGKRKKSRSDGRKLADLVALPASVAVGLNSAHARWVPEVAAPGGRSPGRRPLGLRRDRPVGPDRRAPRGDPRGS
ncbi:hypothetical protein [Methanopyrus kandleri]